MKLIQAIFIFLFIIFNDSVLANADKASSIYFSGEQWRVKAEAAEIVDFKG